MGNRDIVIDQTEPRQTVYIFNCSGSTIQACAEGASAAGVAAAACCCMLCASLASRAVGKHKGVPRSSTQSLSTTAVARLQVRGKVNGITIIDDFGHHPTAIRETFAGLRKKFSGTRL